MRVLILLGILSISTLLGIIIARDPGYALFTYNGWSAEMPLWFFILVWFFGLGAAFCSLKFLQALYRSPSYYLKLWRDKRRQRQASELQLNLSLVTEKDKLIRDGAWGEVLELLENPAKKNILAPAESQYLLDKAKWEYLNQVLNTKAEAFLEAWESLTYKEQERLDYQRLYAQYLHQTEAKSLLGAYLRQQLPKSWDETLLLLWVQNVGEDIESEIRWAEKALRKRGQDPILLACLGHLCSQMQLWGKAREYLSQSIALAPSLINHAWMGELLECIGENEESRQQFKKSLNFVLNVSPAQRQARFKNLRLT